MISIHALLAESDGVISPIFLLCCNFYPRSPCGERRRYCTPCQAATHFYPRSPCGERPPGFCSLNISQTISIHALLAESDAASMSILRPLIISIHALLAESDCISFLRVLCTRYFYPRSPCGERLSAILPHAADVYISIHALLAESDCLYCRRAAYPIGFLSTLSLRRATRQAYTYISVVEFLSTLSLRRATIGLRCVGVFLGISIHALLAESDGFLCGAGGWQHISIHALLAESDRRGSTRTAKLCDFYPRSPCGERPPIRTR